MIYNFISLQKVSANTTKIAFCQPTPKLTTGKLHPTGLPIVYFLLLQIGRPDDTAKNNNLDRLLAQRSRNE
jgi:hypothetical protein